MRMRTRLCTVTTASESRPYPKSWDSPVPPVLASAQQGALRAADGHGQDSACPVCAVTGSLAHPRCVSRTGGPLRRQCTVLDRVSLASFTPEKWETRRTAAVPRGPVYISAVGRGMRPRETERAGSVFGLAFQMLWLCSDAARPRKGAAQLGDC